MRRVFLLLICIYMLAMTASALAQTATPTPTSQWPTGVYYSEVLNRFRFGKGNRPSNAEINAELITELKSRGVYIVLTDHDRKELREAGASEELIKTIDNALTDAQKKKIAADTKKIDEMNRLYQIVLDNYKSNDLQQFNKARDAAKEFIERFGADDRAKDIVGWLRNNVWRPYKPGRID